ncbi:MAG: hypothetical protein ACKKL6_00835 [Candidatus Komeilibacteria bacterium]
MKAWQVGTLVAVVAILFLITGFSLRGCSSSDEAKSEPQTVTQDEVGKMIAQAIEDFSKEQSKQIQSLGLSIDTLGIRIAENKPAPVAKPAQHAKKTPTKKHVTYKKSTKKKAPVHRTQSVSVDQSMTEIFANSEFIPSQRKTVAVAPVQQQVIRTSAPAVQQNALVKTPPPPIGQLKVLVSSDAKHIWGTATNWTSGQVRVKKGIAYIPARTGNRLYINGDLKDKTYLDAQEITLVAPNGSQVTLNWSNSGVDGPAANQKNLVYSYMGGNLSIP